MKAGSLIFLFVSNRIKLPLSPTTISTTHTHSRKRSITSKVETPNLPVRNLDFWHPQQQVGLTSWREGKLLKSLFPIHSVNRVCVCVLKQETALYLFLFFHSLFLFYSCFFFPLRFLLLCSVERRRRLRTVLIVLSRVAGPGKERKNRIPETKQFLCSFCTSFQ